MIIIGGLGSILGSFLGTAFIVLVPDLLNNLSIFVFSEIFLADTLSNLGLIVPIWIWPMWINRANPEPCSAERLSFC